MKTEIIKATFTNLLFVIGVILLIFGFVRGTSTIAKMMVFDKYPLQSYEETRCEMEVVPVTKEMVNVESGEQQQERRELCLTSLENARKVRQVEDMVSSLTTLVAGSVLVVVFKRFIFFKG
jgi:hypothetical protein